MKKKNTTKYQFKSNLFNLTYPSMYFHITKVEDRVINTHLCHFSVRKKKRNQKNNSLQLHPNINEFYSHGTKKEIMGKVRKETNPSKTWESVLFLTNTMEVQIKYDKGGWFVLGTKLDHKKWQQVQERLKNSSKTTGLLL